MPAEKWMNLRLYVESKLISKAGEVGVSVDASSLLTVLGKFHHATLTWPAGRPCHYALWRLYFTATFRNNNPSKLQPKSQTLEVTEDARASILVWIQALTTRPPPIRRMLICSKAVPSITLDILRMKECPRTDNRIWLRLETPSCLWTRPEKLLDKYHKVSEVAGPSKITVWLEALLEGLEVLDCPTLAEAVIVRTNIVKLAETIDNDLYTKSTLGTLIAQRIHVWLEEMDKKQAEAVSSTEIIPLELRTTLVEGGTLNPWD